MYLIVKKIMNELQIEEYRLVVHNTRKYICEFSNDVLKEHVTALSRNSLYFLYSGKMGKIEFSDIEEDVLKKIIVQYMDNKKFYLETMKMIGGLGNSKTGNKLSVDFEDRVGCIKKEVTEKVNQGYGGLMIKDVYVWGNMLVYSGEEIVKEQYEKNFTQMMFFAPHFFSMCSEELPYGGMLDVKKDGESFGINNVEMVLNGVKRIKFSRKVFGTILKMLVQCLNGMNVINNLSIFDKTDFGKQILKKGIFISDCPFAENNTRMFDDEGMELHEKILVDNGKLNECINNILSAGILEQSAGNCLHNLVLDMDWPEQSKVYFIYTEGGKNKEDYEAYITGILDNNVSLDGRNGNLFFNCIGVDKQDKCVQYTLSTNLLRFFNSVIAVDGELEEYLGCMVPEVIVDFSI